MHRFRGYIVTTDSEMFKSLALSALLALGATQFPQGVDAAAALTKSIKDNDTTTTYSSLNPQVRCDVVNV